MVDFFDLLIKRRAVRDFQEKDVPWESIREILKDTCLAPSSGNGQPWRFIIVRNKDWIRKLSDESKRNLLAYLEKNPESHLKKYEAVLRNKNHNVFYNAPCLVYIVCPEALGSAQIDGTLAACYFMFSAAARELGTCWVALGSNLQDPGLLREIGMPEDCKIVAPIIVGYPRSIPSPSPRNAPQIVKILS